MNLSAKEKISYGIGAVGKDMVYMLDTLDYGLRELLDIYIGKEPEETRNGL